MKILPSGHFSYTIDGVTLSKGLRSSKSIGRNSNALIQSVGAIGKDASIKPLPTISLSTLFNDAGVVADDFPFPQIFTLDTHVIVCNRTSILELVGNSLVEKATVTGGELWEAVGVDNFIYLSNGIVSLVRNPNTGIYALSNAAPTCSAICNFNGQIVCGNIR